MSIINMPLGYIYRNIQDKFWTIYLRGKLAGSRRYYYTSDWVTNNIVNWERYLAVFKGSPGVNMVEVGSYEGRSAIWFLNNILTHPDSRLRCIDAFPLSSQELKFDHNLLVAGLGGKVIKQKGLSETILFSLPEESVDIIYVDGSHYAKNVLFDAIVGFYLLKPSGILIFDDYLWKLKTPFHKRPEKSINLFLKSFSERIELLHKDYQVIVRKIY